MQEELTSIKSGIVRLGDRCGEVLPHYCISGSRDVFVNEKPACRQGDNFTEGKVMTQGSKTVFANGLGIAKAGDIVSCGFKVISNSENVLIGN